LGETKATIGFVFRQTAGKKTIALEKRSCQWVQAGFRNCISVKQSLSGKGNGQISLLLKEKSPNIWQEARFKYKSKKW